MEIIFVYLSYVDKGFIELIYCCLCIIYDYWKIIRIEIIGRYILDFIFFLLFYDIGRILVYSSSVKIF